MKKIIYLFMGIIGLMSFRYVPSGEDVVNAFSSGDAGRISVYFDDPVYLTLPGKSSSFDKQTAKNVLQEFFIGKKVKQFTIIHKGGNDASQFLIGNLLTTSGAFRTTLFLKNKNTTKTIQEIRIESN